MSLASLPHGKPALADRVALITGGTQGIGRATALAFAREGAGVALCYHANDEAAERTRAELESLGAAVLVHKTDVADAAQCKCLVERTVERFGRVDVLVSNAAKGGRNELLGTSEDEYRAIFDTNVGAFFTLARAVLPGMRERRFGRVIAISSIIGMTGRGYFGRSTYGASKAALISYVKGIAREVGPGNITANAIAPGWIDNGKNTRPENEPVKQQALREIPLGRLGQPEDIAATALFLASDGASYITGQTISVNGGLLMP